MKYCDDHAALLDLYVDGELSPREMADVQAHLDACPGCRAYVDDALAIRAAFSDLDDTEIPAGFAEGVMAAIRAQSAPAAEVPAPQKRRTSLWVRSLLPLAACFAVVLLLQRGSLFNHTQELAMDTTASVAETTEEEAAPAACEDAPADDSGTAYSNEPEALSDFAAAPEMAVKKNETRTVLSNAPAAACFDSAAVLTLPAEAGETELLAALTPVQTEDGTLQYQLSAEEYAVLLEQLAEAGISLDALPSADECSGTVLVAVAPAED